MLACGCSVSDKGNRAMSDIAESVRGAIEAHAKELAQAQTSDAVDQLVPKIVKDAEERFEDPRTDPWAYRAVIVILGVIVLGVLFVYGFHSLTPDVAAAGNQPARILRPLPEALIAIGSVALGALAGILAPVPRS